MSEHPKLREMVATELDRLRVLAGKLRHHESIFSKQLVAKIDELLTAGEWLEQHFSVEGAGSLGERMVALENEMFKSLPLRSKIQACVRKIRRVYRLRKGLGI